MFAIARLLFNYMVLDLRADRGPSPLPLAPSIPEKYAYTRRSIWVLILATMLSFACVTYSASQLFAQRWWLLPFFLILVYSVIYFVTSTLISLLSRDFDRFAHDLLVRGWAPVRYPGVDVFLPNCGEPLDVLRNTWDGVAAVRRDYRGKVVVHCLDDAHRPEVRALAQDYGFIYHARPNRGWFKKAGNLRHGFANSDQEFIVIFDADFRPRSDFLDELLPYFTRYPRVGIVQSPQYFGFSKDQNWLERGAGAVQELFYRSVQVSRQSYGGSICVGSNAIYRRAALDEIGGTALIEHSEDVHTGFQLKRQGWDLVYVPIVLAKGLCPSDLKAFFKQQYRWCMGSMSLLTSRAFWQTRMPVMTRLCYGSGFMYYVHTAIYAVFTPVIPLVMLIGMPEEIRIANYLLILPSFLYVHVIFPLWHRKPQGIEAAATRLVYGWAHLFALIDKMRGRAQEWQPTGARHAKDRNYRLFRAGVLAFNFVPAVAWISLAAWYMATWDFYDFLPVYLIGLYYFFTVLKVVAWRSAEPDPAAAPAGPTRPAGRAHLGAPAPLWLPAELRV
jgi:cellulose synthase (UDP-forming)